MTDPTPIRTEGATKPARDLAIIVPAYNEEGGIGETVARIRQVVDEHGLDAEIVIVDDGSTDGTADVAEKTGERVIRQPANVGYGFALKTGIAETRSAYVAILDADGTYPPERLPDMLEMGRRADMVVGDRGQAMRNVPLVRKPAKFILNRVADLLARRHIPDLNSGLRVFRRESLERFVQLLPDGFSFTTTITLCMICSNLHVEYTPIDYAKRVGKSKIRPVDFFNFLLLVVRIIVLFQPLRVFLPLGGLLFLFGTAKAIYDVTRMDLSESAIFALLASIMVFSLGLIADMISRLHLRR